MTEEKIEELRSRRLDLLQEVMNAPLWTNGSVVETTRKQSGKIKPYRYLSRSIMGRNQTTYVSEKELGRFKTAAAEGARIRRLMTEISEITVRILKAGGGNGQ